MGARRRCDILAFQQIDSHTIAVAGSCLLYDRDDAMCTFNLVRGLFHHCLLENWQWISSIISVVVRRLLFRLLECGIWVPYAPKNCWIEYKHRRCCKQIHIILMPIWQNRTYVYLDISHTYIYIYYFFFILLI